MKRQVAKRHHKTDTDLACNSIRHVGIVITAVMDDLISVFDYKVLSRSH